jgi:predicted DNA-binding protein
MINDVTLNIRLPLALVRRLDQAAFARAMANSLGRRCTRSAVIRELIEVHTPPYEEPAATPRVRSRTKAA